MILDGAEVIAISKKGNFGIVRCRDNYSESISIKYLAICKYDKDETIYMFLCNEKMEVEQDNTYDSVDDAKKHAKEKIGKFYGKMELNISVLMMLISKMERLIILNALVRICLK
jgi:hypothetical protein